MKTNINKIIAVVTALVGIGMLSSYTFHPKKETKVRTVTHLNNQQKVYEFIQENICIPISQQLKGELKIDNQTKYFSRCPSGYSPQITSKRDSVKTAAFVSGKIVYYKGCNAMYVCDFKVCVDKHFIVVRTKGSDYKSVSAWIVDKNETYKGLVRN